jgi:transcriptional regulator with PAS, ATPase and Fis domain
LFLQNIAALQKHVTGISEDAMALLLDHIFRNVRELENIIGHSIALSGDGIESAHLPDGLKWAAGLRQEGLIPSLEDQKAYHLGIERVAGQEPCGLDPQHRRVSLWRKLKRYGLENQ